VKAHRFLSGVAFLTALTSASAQTDPVIQRIWRLGMDSSRVEFLAARLFDSIGPRLTGTPNMRSAQQWLVKNYTSWGIDAKVEQYGTWRGWRRGYSHVDLVAPRQRTLDATMLGWSPGTGKIDVEATTIILPKFADSTEFVKWLPQVKGKLVLISPPTAVCRPAADLQENATPASLARMDSARAATTREWGNSGADNTYRGTGYTMGLGGGSLSIRLDAAGVAGTLTSRPKDAWGTREVFETYSTRAPGLSLSCEDYGLVYRLTENKMSPRIRMNLDAELLGEQPASNVIATMKGTTKPNEYVMLSAHFDSWDASSGATDNGTGSLVMHEAMRILKQVLPRPQRTIMAGHWSAEENGLVGSRSFATDHPEIVNGIQALFNQDNGTGRIERLSASGWPDAPNHLLKWYDQLPKYFQDQAPFYGGGGASAIGTAGGGSDNASFACYGAPTFGLGARGWDYSQYTWHTERDTYDKVIFDDLKANATLVAMLAYLASEDPDPVRRDSTIALITRPRPDSVVAANEGRGGRGGRGGGGGGGGGRGGRGGGGRAGADAPPRVLTIADCPKGDRKTKPRL
jgi:hypothetical protein